jgi:lipoteichoic acid synthase
MSRKQALLISLSFVLMNALKVTYFDYLVGFKYFETRQLALNFFITLPLVALAFGGARRLHPLAAVGFYAMQIIYLGVNLCLFRYSLTYPMLRQMLALAREGLSVVSSSRSLLTSRDLVFLADLPLLALACQRGLVTSLQRGRPSWRGLGWLSGLGFAGLALLIVACNRTPEFYWNDPNDHAIKLSLTRTYGLFTTQLLREWRLGDPHRRLKYPPVRQIVNAIPPVRPNFVAIQIESLSANVLQQRGPSGQLWTPFLNELSQRSVYFPALLSYHKAGGTSDIEVTVNNGIEPLAELPLIKMLDRFPNSLAPVLRGGGYVCKAFHNNQGSVYNRYAAYRAMGFDEFFDVEALGLPKDALWGSLDGNLMPAVLRAMKAESKPFYYYVITLSSHMPFNYVPESVVTSAGCEKYQDTNVRNYCRSVSYVDGVLSEFFAAVAREPALQNTYFFLYGDHPPAINVEEFRDSQVFTNLTKLEYVPLLIVTPDKRRRQESRLAASMLDIAPTILESAGGRFEYATAGQSLLRGLVDEPLPYATTNFTRSQLFELYQRSPSTEKPGPYAR